MLEPHRLVVNVPLAVHCSHNEVKSACVYIPHSVCRNFCYWNL